MGLISGAKPPGIHKAILLNRHSAGAARDVPGADAAAQAAAQRRARPRRRGRAAAARGRQPHREHQQVRALEDHDLVPEDQDQLGDLDLDKVIRSL